MQYISFYKDRLPFQPKSNVVIYFDVMGIGRKLYYNIIDSYYERIVHEFRNYGLEFCFLPRIAQDMDLKKIYHYFNPQISVDERIPFIDYYRDSDLLECIVADYDSRRLSPGLIQYMGESFDSDVFYVFSYTPLPEYFSESPIPLIQQYVMQHGVRESLFNVSRRPQNPIVAADDVEMMMSEAQMLVERLRQSGVGEMVLQRLFRPTPQLSRMHIKYGRIFLPDYNNIEIRMHPLSKVIYLLYLRHSEGIMFSYLPDYRRELLQLYGLVSGRDNMEDIRRSIDDVTDPTRNSINEKCSRIKQAFLREFDDSIARNYYITGERGEAKKILLPREMVTWDMPD